MNTISIAEDRLLEQFDELGYVIVPGMLENEIVEAVRHEMVQWVDRHAKKLQADGLIEDSYESEPFETRLIRLYANRLDRLPSNIREELHLPGMYDLFFHPRLLNIAEMLLGSEIRLYPNYSVRPKFPEHAKTQVLWHQDAGYTASGQHGSDLESQDTRVDQLRMVNVWSPLVPARPENGCMKFIPGTHRLGTVPHVEKEYYLEIVEKELQPRLKDAVDIVCDPGDVVLFSNLLFHTGQPNRSETIRWSCDWRYQDATQSTMRRDQGHLARSQSHPETVVQNAEHWANLSFQ